MLHGSHTSVRCPSSENRWKGSSQRSPRSGLEEIPPSRTCACTTRKRARLHRHPPAELGYEVPSQVTKEACHATDHSHSALRLFPVRGSRGAGTVRLLRDVRNHRDQSRRRRLPGDAEDHASWRCLRCALVDCEPDLYGDRHRGERHIIGGVYRRESLLHRRRGLSAQAWRLSRRAVGGEGWHDARNRNRVAQVESAIQGRCRERCCWRVFDSALEVERPPSLAHLDLRVTRGGNREPRTAGPFEIRVEKTVYA